MGNEIYSKYIRRINLKISSCWMMKDKILLSMKEKRNEKISNYSEKIKKNYETQVTITRKIFIFIIVMSSISLLLAFLWDYYDLSKYIWWNISSIWLSFLTFILLVLTIVFSNLRILQVLIIDYLLLKEDSQFALKISDNKFSVTPLNNDDDRMFDNMLEEEEKDIYEEEELGLLNGN